MSTQVSAPSSRSNLGTAALARLAAAIVLFAAILFGTAGTFDYWEAWLFLAVLFIPVIGAFVVLILKAPDVLERRMRTREKERVQNPILALITVALLVAIVLPGLDHRFGWSAVPVWLVIAADLVLLLGYGLFLLVLRENHYASRTIEVEQGQKVVDTGPYAVVRHPMYVAVLLIYFAMPIALGSYWALLPVLVVPVAVAARILTEETTLARDLPGYVDYTQQVRYRLVPGIW